MNDLLNLYDSKFVKRYFGFHYRGLIKYSCFKLGPRNFLDKIVLSIQSLLRSEKKKDSGSWKKLFSVFDNKISACLFYDTSWYKQTKAIGLVESEGRLFFTRVHPHQEDIVFHTYQARFVQDHFSGPFTVIPITKSQDLFTVSPFIPHKRKVDHNDHIDQHILHLSQKFLQQTDIIKTAREIMPIDMGFVCAKAGQMDLFTKIGEWINVQDRELPVIPVHGDMTPWNMFVSLQEKIVLVDYERAGWHVPYYDYFHYLLQPLALKKDAVPMQDLPLDKDIPDLKQYLILYLIDQLYTDMSDRYEKNHDHKHLHYLIANKRRWLMDCLDHG